MQHHSPDLSAQDVNLLHHIIVRAQNHPDFPSHPKRVLLEAYDAIFTENGLDTGHDRACLRLLLQLGEPGVPGQTLYEKFEHLLEEAGIVLDFDDDRLSIADAERGKAIEEEKVGELKDPADIHTSPRKVTR